MTLSGELFQRYVGIDYSGAQTPRASLEGLRVYVADRGSIAYEVQPPPSPCKYWTRSVMAEWLVERLTKHWRTLVGIDHGFSFPMRTSNVTSCRSIGLLGKVDALTAIANNLLRDEQLADAHDLIHQVRTVLENETDTFLRTTEQAGTTAYATDLTDAPLWQTMRNIAGRGYVQYQVEANATWFAQQAQAQQFIRGLIANGWHAILTRVCNLLNTDATG